MDGEKLAKLIHEDHISFTDEDINYVCEHLPEIVKFLRISGNRAMLYYYTIKLQDFEGYKRAREERRKVNEQ